MALSKAEFKKMNKTQLEEYGRSIGIELDRRLKKDTIIQQLVEFETPPDVVSSVTTRPDRVSATPIPADLKAIKDFIDSLPEYNGENNGALSSLIVKKLNLFSGHKVQFGPDEKGYRIIVKGPDVNTTYRL